ncbi:MAG TPA: hypothetical protein VNW90_10760 [Acetobacteraceae bacterium]|nr:hypothetical protein [Acetobacteraceae bacterium]
MSTATEALDACHAHLSRAKVHATRLGRMLDKPNDAVCVIMLPTARSDLAEALRNASDAAETIGAEHLDTRWCAVVALVHNASSAVWTVRTSAVCTQVCELMDRLRYRIEQLRHSAMSHAITVRMSS